MTQTNLDFRVKLTAEIVPHDASQPLTAADYHPGESLHNARVFNAIWHHPLEGVNWHGIFEVSEGPMTLAFQDIPSRIKKTDVFSKLSDFDYTEAAAMLFHILPETENQ